MQDSEAKIGEKVPMRVAGRGELPHCEAVGGGAVARSSWEPTTELTERPEADTQHSARLRDRRKRADGQIPLRDNSQA